MDAVLRAHGPLAAAPAVRLRIRTIVLGGPAGDVAYEVALDSDQGVRRLDPRRPDASGDDEATTITFTSDHATAVAIATGSESAQGAFMAGRLRVSGDTRLL